MKYTLITWATSWIGYEFAHIFGKMGNNLILVWRDIEKLTDIKNEFPKIQVDIISLDLSEQNAAQELYKAIGNKEVDVLVNNAGFWDFWFFHEIDIQKELAMIDLNVRTLTELTYIFWKDMVSRKTGKILNVASTAAFFPWPLMSVYYATKHYVLAFSQALAEEWGDFWVVVTTLCPWPTQSNFQKNANLQGSNLFKWKDIPTAKQVAEFWYSQLMKGKKLAVYGLRNKLLIAFTRYIPMSVSAWIVKKLQAKN